MRFDATAGVDEPWDVVDAEGDVIDSFASEAEAREEADQLNDVAEADDLRERIEAALVSYDLDQLRSLAASMNGVCD